MSNNTPAESQEEGALDKPRKGIVREYVEAIAIALVAALFIRTFMVQAFKIPSGSMKDTLLIGDHLLVSKSTYGIHIPNEIPFLGIEMFPDYRLFPDFPKRGDIVVFKFPLNEKKDFIKRVIGLPGETLEVRHQHVYINGQPLNEPYVKHTVPPSLEPVEPRDDLGPVIIPEGHVFVMGDNRENSHDSRMWGFLDVKKIRGKAQWIYWSWDSKRGRLRYRRIGHSVNDN